MRRRLAAIAAALACPLIAAGCTDVAGAGATMAVKTHQNADATDHEQAIARRLAADPALSGLKVSVAVANRWQDGFQTRTSVLMAGTAPTSADRDRALAMIRDTIGGDPATIAILDRSRISGP